MQQLQTIDADTLMSTPLPVTQFIVEDLLPEGGCISSQAHLKSVSPGWPFGYVSVYQKENPCGSCLWRKEQFSISV